MQACCKYFKKIYICGEVDGFLQDMMTVQSLVGFFPEFQGLQTNIVHKNGICPSFAFSVSRNIAVMKRGISGYLYTQRKEALFLRICLRVELCGVSWERN